MLLERALQHGSEHATAVGPFADFIPRVLGDHPILARLEMVGADQLLKDLDVRPIPIRERVVSGAFEEQLDQQREGKGAE